MPTNDLCLFGATSISKLCTEFHHVERHNVELKNVNTTFWKAYVFDNTKYVGSAICCSTFCRYLEVPHKVLRQFVNRQLVIRKNNIVPFIFIQLRYVWCTITYIHVTSARRTGSHAIAQFQSQETGDFKVTRSSQFLPFVYFGQFYKNYQSYNLGSLGEGIRRFFTKHLVILEDPGFESRQGVRFLGIYTLQGCSHN
jgi:hypothetical protein